MYYFALKCLDVYIVEYIYPHCKKWSLLCYCKSNMATFPSCFVPSEKMFASRTNRLSAAGRNVI